MYPLSRSMLRKAMTLGFGGFVGGSSASMHWVATSHLAVHLVVVLCQVRSRSSHTDAASNAVARASVGIC